jgi:hypothetical protein
LVGFFCEIKTMTDFIACYKFLQNYAEFLSANPNFRPHPILFSAPFCQGSYWPAFDVDPNVTNQILTTDNLFSSNYFGSLYIPSGYQVLLNSADNSTSFTFPSNPFHPYTLSPVLLNVNQLFYPNNQTIQNNVKSVSITGPMRFNNQGVNGTWTPDTFSEWAYRRCMGKEQTVVGLSPLTSYESGSDECETYMTAFCEANPDDSACTCIQDEKTLHDQFCNHLSNDDTLHEDCNNMTMFSAKVPTVCFGSKCASTGYRFQRFRQANCNVTYCQQVIQLVGNDVSISGASNLWCGNDTLENSVNNNSNNNNINNNNNNNASNIIAPVSDTPSATLSWWQWMLIFMGVILVCIIFPIFFILRSKSKNNNNNNDIMKDHNLNSIQNHELWTAPAANSFSPDFSSFEA